MKKIFTSTLIFLAINICLNISAPISAQAEDSQKPSISITNTSSSTRDPQSKLIKVKTTIVTQKSEKAEPSTSSDLKKDKRDIELSTDVDKILKEMDIDDADPLTETPATPVETIYKPVKKNFIWIAFSIIVFPVILFALLIKAMQATKIRFEKEEKEKGLSKEEKLLDDLEREQKKTKKKHRSLSDILGGSRQKVSENTGYDNDFDSDEEDFEFMVEEVVLVEEQAHAPQEPINIEEPIKHAPPQEEPEPEIETEFNSEEQPSESQSDVIDSFEISDNLKFLLVKKENTCNLICRLGEREIIIMNLDKAQKFNKVRKIDSKPGRDVYMVKLDSWRGLIEVKEDSVKYLMDI